MPRLWFGFDARRCGFYAETVHVPLLQPLRRFRRLTEKQAIMGLRRFPASARVPPAWMRGIDELGYHVVPEYLSSDQCDELIAEFHRLQTRFPELVHHHADQRLFAAERASAPIAKLITQPTILDFMKACYKTDDVSGLALIAHLPLTEGKNLGSGGGWHRDSPVPQFKFILYLSDVNEDNGPFQFVPRSHRLLNKWADMAILDPANAVRVRFEDDEIERLVARRYPEGVTTAVGKRGTLLLANTSGFHRGSPIRAGERYAVTFYCYPGPRLADKLLNHFAPLVPESDEQAAQSDC